MSEEIYDVCVTFWENESGSRSRQEIHGSPECEKVVQELWEIFLGDDPQYLESRNH